MALERGGPVVAAITAILVGLLTVAPAVQAVANGYWDTTDPLKGKGREPMLVAFGGELFSFYQFRTELRDVGIDQAGRRSDIYYRVFNGTNWSAPVTLVPNTKDTNGHGLHQPRATEYKGKLYVTGEAVEPSIKDDDAQGDYDIVMRVWDGNVWSPPLDGPAQVISEKNDVNVTDYECRSIVFGDTLYFVWSQIPVDASHLNGSESEHRRIVYRTFDGVSWGPISVAAQDQVSFFGMSDLAMFKDRLWVSFQTNTSESADMDIMACSFDGTSWTVPQRVNPAVEGSPVKRQNLNARMGVYGDRLYCVWQSLDTIAKSSSNYDVMISSSDGASWSYAEQVNRPNDEGQDRTPDVKANAGILYVVWSSDDSKTTDEQQDTDIMIRTFDGRNWGQASLVSPFGDNGTISGDHNPGDDDTPFLLSWQGRLYCTWITYDQLNTGHKGGNPSVMVKLVIDSDSDGDGVPDGRDAFPKDPAEWKDTDSDGVGDNRDIRPDDPAIWRQDQLPIEKSPVTMWPLAAGAAVALLVCLAAGLAFVFRKRGKSMETAKTDHAGSDRKGNARNS
jgi:hypothetical protein